MRIALSKKDEFIASTFDWSPELLVIDYENNMEKNRFTINLSMNGNLKRFALIKELGVQVLIIGAISEGLLELIINNGIQLYSFIKGNVDDVLKAFIQGKLSDINYQMPGCRKEMCQRKRSQGKRNRHF